MKLFELVAQYVSYKRALGMRFNSEAATLAAFCHRLDDRSGSAKLNRSDKCIIGVLCCGKKAVEGDPYEQIIRATDTSRIQR